MQKDAPDECEFKALVWVFDWCLVVDIFVDGHSIH